MRQVAQFSLRREGWWQEEYPTVKTNAMYKNADCLLWRPLIGKKPKDKEEEESIEDVELITQCIVQTKCKPIAIMSW